MIKAEKTLSSEYPERQSEIRQLQRLLAIRYCPPIFVYGLPGTGKTTIVRAVVQELVDHAPAATAFAYADCIETHNVRLLVELLLSQLLQASWLREGEQEFDGEEEAARLAAGGGTGLVRGVGLLAAGLRAKPWRRCLLVLDAAHRLPEALLAVILRLPALVRAPVTVVLLAPLAWDKLRPSLAATAPEPQLVLFADYIPQEVLEILVRRAQELWPDANAQLRRQYVGVLHSVFNLAAKRLVSLAPLLPLYWPFYKRPVDEGRVRASDAAKLYQELQPLFTRSLMLRALTRQVTHAELEQCYRTASVAPAGANEQALQRRALGSEFELPWVGKVLMVAAYIASWTPPSADRRLTSRAPSRIPAAGKRKRPSTPAEIRRAAQPGAFDLPRLTALFHVLSRASLSTGQHRLGSTLLTQVATLVSLNLLTMVARSHGALVGAPKLCCNMPRDYIASLAKNLNIELENYLLDAG